MQSNQQWEHYAGLTGEWHGVWHRYAVDQDGVLAAVGNFPAVCHMALAADGQSVRHKNRYTPGSQPPGPPGQVVDGMHEVDFGVFDPSTSKFQHPFGPHSLALYSDGMAAMGTASLSSCKGMAAVEFVLADPPGQQPRHRRRLVATWRVSPDSAEDEGAVGQLATLTSIIEADDADAAAAGAGDDPMRGGLEQWQGERRATHVDGTELPEVNVGKLDVSKIFMLPGGVIASLPLALPLRARGSLEPWMGWRRTEGELIRVAAVYADGELTAVASDVFTPPSSCGP